MIRVNALLMIALAAGAAWSADDVDEIANGFSPKGKRMTLLFTEELRIGPDGGEDYHLWSGSYVSIDADANGALYVADTGGDRVLVFDAKGQFLRQIGGPGEGPGEFQGLYSFSVMPDGSAAAFTNNQNVTSFHFFDANMKFLKREINQPQPVFIQSAAISPNHKWLAATFMKLRTNGGMLTAYTGVLSRESKEIKVAFSQQEQAQFDQNRVEDPAFWSDFLASWFKLASRGVGVMAFDADGSLYSARTDQYRIVKWSPELEERMVITRQYKPIGLTEDQLNALVEPIRQEVIDLLPPFLKGKVTENVARRAVEKAEFLPRKQPIFGLIPMDGKGLLVIHDYNSVTHVSTADIFDKDGRFLGQATLPKINVNIFGGFFGGPASLVFKNGKAYAALPNEDGEFEAVRYGYKLVPAR